MRTNILAQRARYWSLVYRAAHENTCFPCCISVILFLVLQDENTRYIFSFCILEMKFKSSMREKKLPNSQSYGDLYQFDQSKITITQLQRLKRHYLKVLIITVFTQHNFLNMRISKINKIVDAFFCKGLFWERYRNFLCHKKLFLFFFIRT